MPSLATRFLLGANRLLPAPALPGSPDSLEYARWEYDTSESLMNLWLALEGDLPRRVLDLGCGLGGKTHRLHEARPEHVDYVALDIAIDHLREAETYHRHVGISIPKTCGDAAHLPFADGSFDHILTTDTLEHFPKPRAALREMRRCLAPDGRVILIFNPWSSPRGSHLGDLLYLPWCQLLFSRDTLREATLLSGEQRAAGLPEPEAATVREFARSLVDHFEHHLHPTRIRDLHHWLEEDDTFSVERDLRLGPGPLANLRWPWPEVLTASYAVVMRPR